MIIIGLLLIPVFVLMINKISKVNEKKLIKKIYNILLIGISFLYICLSLFLHIEPFDFQIEGANDCLIYMSIIFIFSPNLWIVLFYYCKKVFKSLRIHKNAKIKVDREFFYYRDDLNKVSPSIIMFTSIMDIDFEKCISSTLLKLKLTGYIKEENGILQCTNKKDDGLLESEKMVLGSIKYKTLDEKKYKKQVEREAIKNKFLKVNNKGKIIKLLKILLTIILPIIFIIASFKLDSYTCENYKVYVYDDVRYVSVNKDEIGDIYFGDVENIEDYYYGVVEMYGEEEIFYDKALIKMDKFEYDIVKIRFVLDIAVSLSIFISIVFIYVAIFMVIEQIIYFNKNYIRTVEGNELLDKAYALKNYLKDYSLINNRTQEELVLWEYYLVYSVVLDVNEKIKDKIIEDYLKNIAIR